MNAPLESAYASVHDSNTPLESVYASAQESNTPLESAYASAQDSNTPLESACASVKDSNPEPGKCTNRTNTSLEQFLSLSTPLYRTLISHKSLPTPL